MDAEEYRKASAELEAAYVRGEILADEYLERKLRLSEGETAPEAPPETARELPLEDASEAAPSRAEALVYASWGRRAGGWLVDVAVLVTVIVATSIWADSTSDPVTDEISDAAALAVLGAYLVVPALYPWLMVGRFGQTLGKMAVGTKVLRAEDGERVGYARALGRVAASWLLGLLLLPLLVAYLWPLWDARNQTLYDKLAGTVVVRLP